MKLTSFLIPALASIAAAAPDFAIGTQLTVTAKDGAQLASITSAYVKAMQSWQASVTAKPEWTSAYSALVDFQETGKNVPEGVTATDVILTYATTPDWYNAMPTDLKNYVEKNRQEQDAIRESILASVKGDAATARSLGIYLSGAMAALVAGVAIGL
ncbi:uncharacterized protein EKO05_0006926 [Ascochyta rabiei]|uniref:Uncharacterized protein n=1 Tax=Didymella rabiei TaxID=5454 RepID=A0A162Z2U7_DIDRA|nr:uncharacterized protein EKO05_0006926 [Ascochyta rabiei]KZM20368.1 hypothetical protein ST47_g8503 [Ascochyta rabiei]UPX16529.1 hypothetical protein EKO05_0006926 [Ascochyta rabiei]